MLTSDYTATTTLPVQRANRAIHAGDGCGCGIDAGGCPCGCGFLDEALRVPTQAMRATGRANAH